MSNIYEALEQASRERKTPAVSNIALPAHTSPSVSMTEEMTRLHHQVDFLLPSVSHKVIQFMGTHRGGGVSTIVREFAKVAVERLGKSVLILDSAYQDPARKINLNITCEYGWLDLLEKEELVDKAFFRFGDSNLFFAPISFHASLVAPVKDLSATSDLWMKLKDRFDLILIDASSDPNNAESVALSRSADGVVLVLEAEKSRRNAVKNIVKRISDNGGNVLGVVLNKRRYYIPKCIFEKL